MSTQKIEYPKSVIDSIRMSFITFPKSNSILFRTKDHEYLVDINTQRLIAKDQEPVLEKLIASMYKNSNGIINAIRDIFDIPLDSEIIFLEKEKPPYDKSQDIPKLKTKPIKTIGQILTEKEIPKYLQIPSLPYILN